MTARHKVDSLGFKPYAKAIAEFLTDKDTRSPLTLSIEGQWGCGKSSFMLQLENEIKEGNSKYGRKAYITHFDSWMYDKEDELWAAFALSIMEQLSSTLSWWKRLLARKNLLWLRLK